MPLIHTIPVNQGITREKIAQRLATGWVYVGQMAVQEGSGVLDPTRPVTSTGAVVMHIWLLPEPLVPAGALLQLLQSMYEQADKGTLNAIARQLFGRTVPELESAADSPQEGEKGGEAL
jgi:hypothetical protein